MTTPDPFDEDLAKAKLTAKSVGPFESKMLFLEPNQHRDFIVPQYQWQIARIEEEIERVSEILAQMKEQRARMVECMAAWESVGK